MFFSQPLLLCLVKAHCPRPKSNVNSLEKLPGEELHGLFLYPNSTLIISQLRCLLHHTVLFVSQAEQCLCSLKSRRLEGGDPCLTQQYTALHLAQDHQDVLIKESKRERWGQRQRTKTRITNLHKTFWVAVTWAADHKHSRPWSTRHAHSIPLCNLFLKYILLQWCPDSIFYIEIQLPCFLSISFSYVPGSRGSLI